MKRLAAVRELFRWGPWVRGGHYHITRCGVQIVQSCHQGRWRGVSLSCAAYAESLSLLNLPYARKKQRDKWVTTGELSVLRGLLGQWLWLASSPCVDLGSLTQLRTHVHDSFVFWVALMEAERVAVMDNVGV